MSESITPAVRDYLVALARGDRSIIPWRGWCDAHRDALTAIHGRAGFLKLKFEPQRIVPGWLTALGIERGDSGAMLRRAGRGAGWDTSPDVFGVRALYAKGRREKADAKLRDVVSSALDEGRAARDGFLALCDLGVDAEALFEDGFIDEAHGLAAALATLDATDDQLVPIVHHARETLEAIDARARR